MLESTSQASEGISGKQGAHWRRDGQMSTPGFQEDVPFPGHSCSNCGTVSTPLWRRSPSGAMLCNACGLYLKTRAVVRPSKKSSGPQRRRTTYIANASPAPSQFEPATRSELALHEPKGSCPGKGSCNSTGGAEGCESCPAYHNRVTYCTRSQESAHRGASNDCQSASYTDTASGVSGSDGSDKDTYSGENTKTITCQNCGTTITPMWRRDQNGQSTCNACGLYYKFHGCYRPRSMKKPILKRRRRLVQDQLDTRIARLLNSSSPSPEVSSTASGRLLSNACHHSTSALGQRKPRRFSYFPLPVDWTGYQIDFPNSLQIPLSRTLQSWRLRHSPLHACKCSSAVTNSLDIYMATGSRLSHSPCMLSIGQFFPRPLTLDPDPNLFNEETSQNSRSNGSQAQLPASSHGPVTLPGIASLIGAQDLGTMNQNKLNKPYELSNGAAIFSQPGQIA